MIDLQLNTVRKERGLSQKAISDEIGVAQATYCNIENGKRRPSVAVAKKIGAALGFDWTRFFEDAPEEGEGQSEAS